MRFCIILRIHIHSRLPTCTLGLIVENSSFMNSRQSSRPRSLSLSLSLFLPQNSPIPHTCRRNREGSQKGTDAVRAMFKDNCDRSRGHVSLHHVARSAELLETFRDRDREEDYCQRLCHTQISRPLRRYHYSWRIYCEVRI